MREVPPALLLLGCPSPGLPPCAPPLPPLLPTHSLPALPHPPLACARASRKRVKLSVLPPRRAIVKTTSTAVRSRGSPAAVQARWNWRLVMPSPRPAAPRSDRLVEAP